MFVNNYLKPHGGKRSLITSNSKLEPDVITPGVLYEFGSVDEHHWD